MARAALAVFLVLLGVATLLPADPGTSSAAQELSVAANLLAPYSAASAKVEGDALVLRDFRLVEKGTPGRQLAGRLLLNGGKEVVLGLWGLKVAGDMARATPLLGHEGPGQTFLNPRRPGGGSPVPAFVPFRRPVRLTLIPLDARGAPCTPRQVEVREIRLAGGR
jgi:hypothetical protein